MTIEVSEINGTNCKTYLLVSGRHAALVDPVRERYDTYQLVLASRELTLEMVLETHMQPPLMITAGKARLRVPVMNRASPSRSRPHVDDAT